MKKYILTLCLVIVLLIMTSCSNTPKNFEISELLEIPIIQVNGIVETDDTRFNIVGDYNTKEYSGCFTVILDSLIENKDEEIKLYIEDNLIYTTKKDMFSFIKFFNRYNVPPELKGKVYNEYKEEILEIEYIKIVSFESLFNYLNDNIVYKTSEKVFNTYLLNCEIYNNFLSKTYNINIKFKEGKEKTNQKLPNFENNISLDTFKEEHNELRDALNPVEILEVNWVTNSKIAYLDESRKEGTNLDFIDCIIIDNELYLPIVKLFQKFNENLKVSENSNEYYTIKEGNNIHLDTKVVEDLEYFKVKDLTKLGYQVYEDLTLYNIIVIVK